MKVSLVSIIYNTGDDPLVLSRINDAFGSIEECGIEGELILIDNSPEPSVRVEAFCTSWSGKYHWCQGYNTYVSGAWQLALDRYCTGDIFVYVCPAHGRMLDPTWIVDITNPFTAPQNAAAGDVRPCCYKCVAAVPEDIRDPQIHVQGAVAAYRVDAIRKVGGFGYRFPFEYSDVDISRRLLHGGYQLVHIPTIASVASGVVKNRGYKYIHDYS